MEIGNHSPVASAAAAKPARLVSLDALRGGIMLLMASAGLGLAEIAKHFPESALWRIIGFHCEHAEWRGCSLWDLIQPAFMFMVGVALPWSMANRQAKGETFGKMCGHALWRSALLVALAIFLSSNWSKRTEWGFNNVLAQIGLGYPFLFLLAFRSARVLWVSAFGILIGWWLIFALHPLPPPGFDWSSAGIGPDWRRLAGFAAHWEKSVNFAAAFDVWFLNLFPRSAPFIFNAGGYQTLNFVPSIATMVFGVLAGRLLKSELPMAAKLQRLAVAGVAAILIGAALDAAGICPMVKRIWTPGFALFSAGWVALMLAAFVALIDWRSASRGPSRWAFPLIVVGLNPITLYCLWQLSSGFIREQIRTHLGQNIFKSLGEIWSPMLERGSVLIVLWLIVWWMHRRKIFLRI